MERLFRKHFWAVHFVFIFGVMFLVAKTANHFLEKQIDYTPVEESGSRQATKVVAPPPTLSLERLAKLTGLAVPMPEPEIKDEAPVIDLNSPPVHTTLRLKLLGTLVSSVPEWSISSIQDTTSLKSQTYMVGDLVLGATVLEIERARVIILNNNRREFIDANPGDGSALAMAAPPPMPVSNNNPPPSVGMGAGIKALSENEYEVPRGEIDKTLSNLNDVAMQARIVPAFKDGVATGFKILSPRSDSIYAKIGVQNGDVIRRINGFEMNSPEKALEIYTKLKEANRIDIELERNGSTVRKTYNVTR